MDPLKFLLLLGGAAGRMTFEKIGSYHGSGNGGSFHGSVSDGRRIALFGVENYHDDTAYFFTVDSDGDQDSYQYDYTMDEPWYHAALCDDHGLFVEAEDAYTFEVSDGPAKGHSLHPVIEGLDTPVVQVGYFLDDCDDRDLVVLFDTKELANYREEDGTPVCSLRLDRELGWSRATSFALSEKSATAYVVGRHDDSDHRAVAAVKMEEGRCEVIWHATVATESGTPRVLAVNNDDRVEILLTSNEFFARVDRGTSSREGGDVKTLLIEKQLWLPGEGEAIVAYSDAEDAIFSAGYVDGKALLRASSADTGGELYEIDFTDELDAQDPGSVREDYDMDDEAFYEWAENTWWIKGTPTITGIHVLGDKVAVVGAYRGEIADEDGYHYPFVALFGKGRSEPAPAPDDDDDDTPDSPGEPEGSTPAGTTFFGAVVGSCWDSDLKFNDNVGPVGTPAECWDLCVDVYGADSIFAVNVPTTTGNCYCASSCDCTIGSSSNQVIARDTLEELPGRCDDDDFLYDGHDDFGEDDDDWRDFDDDDFGEDDCEYDNPRVCEADGWYWCCDRDSRFSKCGDSYGFCGSGGVSKKTAKGIAMGIIVAIVVVVVVVIAAIVACCVCCKRRRGETAAAAAARRAPSAPPAPSVVQEAPPQQHLPVVMGQVVYGQGAGTVVKGEVVP